MTENHQVDYGPHFYGGVVLFGATTPATTAPRGICFRNEEEHQLLARIKLMGGESMTFTTLENGLGKTPAAAASSNLITQAGTVLPDVVLQGLEVKTWI